MVNFRLVVQEDQLIVEKNCMEVLKSQTKLPAKFELETHGCVEGKKTLYGNHSKINCPLERIDAEHFDHDNECWLVDHGNKNLFKVTKMVQALFGCLSAEP